MPFLEDIVISICKAFDTNFYSIDKEHIPLYENLRYYFRKNDFEKKIGYIEDGIELIQKYVQNSHYWEAMLFYRLVNRRVSETTNFSLYLSELNHLKHEIDKLGDYIRRTTSTHDPMDTAHNFTMHF